MTEKNPKKGLALCLVAISAWGSLPLVLKIALTELDPITVTFFRFSVAALVMLFLKGLTQAKSSAPTGAISQSWKLLLLGGVALTVNHAAFVWGLRYSSAGNSQLFIQLAPFLFGLSSVYLFDESFSRRQGLGVLVLLGGLSLYFSENLRVLVEELDEYLLGCALLIVAALAWVVYACCQRVLNQRLGPGVVTTVFYLMATLLLAPASQLENVTRLPWVVCLALLYCGLNTLVAYGAFAAAINCWESSRVSASLALTPICTLVLVKVFSQLTPQYVSSEEMTRFGILGAFLVVLGSATIALSKGQRAE